MIILRHLRHRTRVERAVASSPVVYLLAVAATVGPLAQSQSEDRNQRRGREADPILCWSRTTASAIRIGERFSLILTCALLETPGVKVVADESKLDPVALQVPPYEVVGGRHVSDVRTAERRFFQYEYELRLINDSSFGKEVPVPGVPVTYRVQTAVGDDAWSEGLERTYALPPQPVRVLSLLSDTAGDLRDASGTTFADLEAQSLHARLLVTTGGVLMGVAALLGVVALVRLSTRGRTKEATVDRALPDRAVLRAIDRELADVRRLRESTGWTRELAGRALAALRIAATYAGGGSVTQRPADPESDRADGALLLRAGFGARRVVFTSATPETIARELAQGRKGQQSARVERLEQLRTWLSELTRAQYGRDEELDEAALDDSLTKGHDLVRRLRREHVWIVRQMRMTMMWATSRGRRVWSR